MGEFEVKDSGKRAEFSSGMVRDTADDKIDYSNLIHHFEPMGTRLAIHLTKGRQKYPDPEPGVPNWKLAGGEEELARYLESADRHYKQWRNGDTDEDHAAAVLFNINGAEYVKAKLRRDRGDDNGPQPTVDIPSGASTPSPQSLVSAEARVQAAEKRLTVTER